MKFLALVALAAADFTTFISGEKKTIEVNFDLFGAPKEITLDQDTNLKVSATENPTTGFQWDITEDGCGVGLIHM